MAKIILFSIIIVVFLSAFNLDFSFFNLGITNISNSIATYSTYFFNFFKIIFNTIFNAPILSIVLSVGFASIIISYILNAVGGAKHD